jgi:hypothetical protein
VPRSRAHRSRSSLVQLLTGQGALDPLLLDELLAQVTEVAHGQSGGQTRGLLGVGQGAVAGDHQGRGGAVRVAGHVHVPSGKVHFDRGGPVGRVVVLAAQRAVVDAGDAVGGGARLGDGADRIITTTKTTGRRPARGDDSCSSQKYKRSMCAAVTSRRRFTGEFRGDDGSRVSGSAGGDRLAFGTYPDSQAGMVHNGPQTSLR